MWFRDVGPRELHIFIPPSWQRQAKGQDQVRHQGEPLVSLKFSFNNIGKGWLEVSQREKVHLRNFR